MYLDLTRAWSALAVLTLVGCARSAAGSEEDAAVRRVGDMSADPSTADGTALDAGAHDPSGASTGDAAHGGGDVSSPSSDQDGGPTPGSGSGSPRADASVMPIDSGSGDGSPQDPPDAEVTPMPVDAAAGADHDAGSGHGGASCSSVETDCDGQCVNVSSTLTRCGGCNTACPAGASSCSSGRCNFDGCTWASYAQHDYLFCKSGHNTTWAGARAFCQALGMDLVRIESAGEDSFVSANILADAWIGLSDLDSEGNWRWIQPGGTTQGPLIYVGTWMGGSVQNGAYTHWNGVDPNDYNGSEDCGRMLSGAWWDTSCSESREFVCE